MTTRAELPYGELRDDSIPSAGNEGFLYLVPNYPKDKNVYKYEAFKIKKVMYRPWLKPYRHYTQHIENINEDTPFPTYPTSTTSSYPTQSGDAQSQDTLVRRGHHYIWAQSEDGRLVEIVNITSCDQSMVSLTG